MFTQEEYIWAWLFYLLGCALSLAVFWVMTRKIKWVEVRAVLRICATVVVLVPWYSDTEGTYLSPAWIVSLLEGIFEGPDAFWRAGTPLIVALILTLILSSGTYAFLAFRARRAQVTE